MIWPVFQIYHMRWRIARYRYTLLARVTQMRQRVEMTTSMDVDGRFKSREQQVSGRGSRGFDGGLRIGAVLVRAC